MSDLQAKANELRGRQPRNGSGGTPPADTGIRLATFQRPEGELRFTWNVYEDRPYLRLQLWSKGEDGGFWPVKGQGFTIKVKELPDLADGLQKALDMALKEGGGPSTARSESREDRYARSREGAGAPF